MPKKPKLRRCRRRHLLSPSNVRVETRFYVLKVPAGSKEPQRTERQVEVCRKCVALTRAARKAGKPIVDQRFGGR